MIPRINNRQSVKECWRLIRDTHRADTNLLLSLERLAAPRVDAGLGVVNDSWLSSDWLGYQRECL